MTILYFITGLGMGGAEVSTIQLANSFAFRGNSVTIVYMNGPNLHKSKIHPKIEVISLEMEKTFIGLIDGFKKAARIIKRISPNVVHGNMYHANIFLRCLRLVVKMPLLVCTEHNKVIGSGIRTWLYRATDWLSDKNTNVSEEATQHFIRKKWFGAKKSYTIYNGIDLQRFTKPADLKYGRKRLNISDDAFVILNVARFTEAKDHVTLIEAFNQFKNFHNNSVLLLIGAGELEANLKQKVSELNLSDVVHFLGIHSDVEKFYWIADCFTLSSAWEGFGIVLVEAMAASLPVISTDAGGCREVVNNDAQIIPTKNSIILTESLKKILALSTLDRDSLIANQLNSVKRFDKNVITEAWENLYNNEIDSFV